MLFGYSLSLGTGRAVAAQQDILFRPRHAFEVSPIRGVVMLPGQLQTPNDWNSDASPFQQDVFRAIASRFAGVVIDAGTAQWGSDAAVGYIETARLYLADFSLAIDKIVLVAASAGVADALNYARANPTRVAALIGIMPACDLDDLRDNDRGSARANINLAWGMPVDSTSATDPLPARANPNTATNAALIASSGALIRLYYSTADTVVVPATVESLAAKLGITPTIISTTTAHSDALFGDMDLDQLALDVRAELV